MDIFDKLESIIGISKYSNSEVITPTHIVKDMVDLLPYRVFNSETKFLDISCKSGRFLLEIYDRLMENPILVDEFPSEIGRSNHILTNQLYGIATSELAALIIRKQLYNDALESGNIVYSDKVDKESIQEVFKGVKFDIVIGNPPYNRGGDIDFIKLGYDLSTEYCVMITPAKWQTAEPNQKIVSEMSYGEFRNQLVPHMSQVVFYPDCKDVFFNAIQPDGITYFILDKEIHDKVTITNKSSLMELINSVETRDISNRRSLLNIGNEIVEYLGNYQRFKFVNTKGRYEIWINNQLPGSGFYRLSKTNKQILVLSTYQIVDSTNKFDFVTSNMAECAFASDNKEELESFISWIYSKFTRFFVIINISKLSGLISDDYFRFVPAPPSGKFDHIYTDQELYSAFNLPQKYIDVIESAIKERN